MCTFPNEENKIEVWSMWYQQIPHYYPLPMQTNYNYSYPNMSKCTTPWNKELVYLAILCYSLAVHVYEE